MNAVWTLVAIFAPWTLGVATCRWARLGWGAAISLGWFAGQVFLMFVGYAIMVAGDADSMRPAAIGMLVVGAAAILINQRFRRSRTSHFSVEPAQPWSWIERLVLAVVLTSLTAKCVAGAASILWNPGRCEDALAYWLFKAKTITLLGEIPIVPGHPFYLGGSNPKYPIFPSMIAAWNPLMSGEWRESWSVIPWLMAFALMPVAAAILLPRGTRRLLRLLTAYIIVSLPLAAIHVFRPGYVDLLLAAFFVCGVVLLFRWIDEFRLGDLILAGIFLIAAACTKREGIVAVTVVTSLFTVFILVRRDISWKQKAMLPLMAGFVGLVVAWLMDASDLATDASHWAYHPEAWAALWRHAVEWSSFSFFFPLALAAAIGLFIVHRGPQTYFAISLCMALLIYAISPFVLTDNVRFALNDQTPSRVLLHIAPAIVVALACGAKRGVACPEALN